MSIKKNILKIEKEMKDKCPELNAGFYVSRRNNCVHMWLDNSIFSYQSHTNINAEINKFFKENLADKFVVNYLQLIHTAKWKFDYIVSRKKK